jgi:hypothetical protein
MTVNVRVRLTLGLLVSEEEGAMIIGKVMNYKPSDTASHPTRLIFSNAAFRNRNLAKE